MLLRLAKGVGALCEQLLVGLGQRLFLLLQLVVFSLHIPRKRAPSACCALLVCPAGTLLHVMTTKWSGCKLLLSRA